MATTLVLMEDAGDELSQQAVTFAGGLGADVTAIAFDASEAYAPAAWAQTLVDLAQQRSARAVVAPGTDRGNEVLAHVAAKLDQPMSANCTSVAPAPSVALTVDESESVELSGLDVRTFYKKTIDCCTLQLMG